MKRYWVTKEGKKILISRMEIQHLMNTKKMLERQAETMLSDTLCNAYAFFNTLHGEMAQYAMEGEIWHLERISKEDFAKQNIPKYEAICYWLKRKEIP